jgi:tight adherence protein B
MQVIILAVFAATFGIVAGAYWLFVLRPEDAELATVRRRLRTRAPRLALAPVVKAEERLSAVGPLNAAMTRFRRFVGPLETVVARSALPVTPGVVLLASVLAGLLGFALVSTLSHSWAGATLVAVALAAMPIVYVKRVASKRLASFEEQFPEAIDLIARSLRAGHALTTALQLAADEMPDPVGPEFQLLFDQQNFGMSLTDALKEFAARVPLLDARFFVTALLTQRETGGNLSAVLDNLARVIRERFTVKRQVRVMSAHGRITGWVLGLMPPTLAAVLFIIAPDHMRLLVDDPIGLRMVLVGVFLQVVGVLAIRRIVDVEY